MDLERLTNEHLETQIKLMQEILEKRKEEEWQENKSPQRLPSDNWDMFPFIDQVESYISFLWSSDDNPDRNRMEESDFVSFIHEAAITMMYGNGIWPKIRERMK